MVRWNIGLHSFYSAIMLGKSQIILIDDQADLISSGEIL